MKRSAGIIAVALLVASPSLLVTPALADPNDAGGLGGNIFDRVFQVFERVQDIGPWEQQHGDVMIAVENVFTDNNWTSDSDQFSIDLIREVGRIPPWQAEQRLDHLVGLLSDRYGFDERQKKLVRKSIINESNKMFFKHAPQALTYSMEMIDARAAGEPFTPDQVARWTEMAMPIFEDAHDNMKEAVQELLPEFTEEQQALMQADLAANDRRFATMEKESERWKRGEWNAADWGLQDDPIQMAEVWAAEDAATALETQPEAPLVQDESGVAERQPPVAQDTTRRPRPRETRPTQRVDRRTTTHAKQDPAKSTDPWEQHVQAFIDRYKLTESQQTAAWRIYRDASQRRNTVQQRNDRRLAAIENHLSEQPERLEKQKTSILESGKAMVDQLFAQMNERLEKLPTRAQRQAVEAAEQSKPAKKKS